MATSVAQAKNAEVCIVIAERDFHTFICTVSLTDKDYSIFFIAQSCEIMPVKFAKSSVSPQSSKSGFVHLVPNLG